MELGLFLVIALVVYAFARSHESKQEERSNRRYDARHFTIMLSMEPRVRWRIDLEAMRARLELDEPDNQKTTDFTLSRDHNGNWFHRMTDEAYHRELTEAQRDVREGGFSAYLAKEQLERLSKGNEQAPFRPSDSTLIEANYQRMLRD